MAARPAFRIVSRAIAATLLVILLLGGAGLYWLGTGHALQWLARQAVAAADGRLVLEGVRGSLYHRITVERAAFKEPALDVEARTIVLQWRPQALLQREARVTELSIDSLRIATTGPGPSELPRLPAALRLPLNVSIVDARLKRVEITPGRVVQDLHFRVRARADAHELDLINVAAIGWRAQGTIRLGAAAPFATTGKLDFEGKALNQPIKVRATVGGTLTALQLQASASARGASALATSLVHPFAATLVEKLTFDAEGVDLAAWDKELPRTRIGVSIEAGMPAPGRFAGTVRIANEDFGPVDAKRLPVSRADLNFTGGGKSWEMSGIDIGLGKSGRVRGSGTVDGTTARFELVLADIAAAELHGRLQPLTLSGTATVTGDAGAQRLVATLEGAGARLELAARHANEVVTVERGELRAEDGRLDFTGRAALTGKREFSATGEFSGLDPARFVNAPAARLNGKVSAQGALAPEWQAKVSLALTDSRLRGQALAADAEFTTSEKQLFSGTARATLAGNRLDLSGRFGEPGDQLKWSLDAANLKALDRSLAGSVNAGGTFAGSLDKPLIEFRLAARGLAAGAVGAGSVEAQGVINGGADGAVRVSARVARFLSPAVNFAEMRIDAKGTRLAHELNAVLSGPELSASLRAAGGLDDTWRWSGTVSALEARGRFPFRITAPARVTAGRGLLTIEDLRAAALGGEIGPAFLSWVNGRITTRGAMRGITAKALLAFAPKSDVDPRDFAIGGRWDFVLADTLSGFAEIARETGDLGVKTEKNLLLGLKQLALNVTARDNALEAVLDVQSARMGTLAGRVRTRAELRDGALALMTNAPLDGNVTLDMQSLAWVRVFVPQLDQVGGRIAARLAIAGTTGRPLITGDASADDVQVRAVGPGLNLTDGTLRASFDGRTLSVSRFYLKAGDGKIEADGVADLSDGLKSLDISARAERARILASPQLTVVLSGAGRAGLRDLQLALEGKFKIDEGRYDLGSERKPALGDDVVVGGATHASAPGAKPLRIILDLTVDLNDKFAVRGHGLDAVLGGALRLATRADTLHALGTIRIVRGDYLAFGQLLDIQRGEVNFSGPLGNPGIDLRAGRKIKSVEVGVEVKGSLQRPVVTLVSDPVMSDSDRLAWLLLGRDPQTATAAELALLQAMALTSDSSRSPSMQKKIAEGLGLDEFGVSQGGAGAVGALALGKRITDQLTVRLEQSLGGTAAGLLKIDYLLSERWRLEGTAGAESAADILFTLRFD